jgi:hypothetical protein
MAIKPWTITLDGEKIDEGKYFEEAIKRAMGVVFDMPPHCSEMDDINGIDKEIVIRTAHDWIYHWDWVPDHRGDVISVPTARLCRKCEKLEEDLAI